MSKIISFKKHRKANLQDICNTITWMNDFYHLFTRYKQPKNVFPMKQQQKAWLHLEKKMSHDENYIILEKKALDIIIRRRK